MAADRTMAGSTDGATVEQAAAREYLYRWRLALMWSGEGSRESAADVAPHLLGM